MNFLQKTASLLLILSFIFFPLFAANAINGQNYSETYAYDAIGNVTSKNGTSYTYSQTGKTNPHAVTSIGSTNYTYDDNGNLLSDGTLTNTWNYENRLTQSVIDSTTIEYIYDVSGQRIGYSNGTDVTYYPTKDYNITGEVPTKQIFANDQLVATVKDTGYVAEIYFVHTDHLTGSNVITNGPGTVEEVMDYYPYGDIRLDEKAGTFSEQRKYAGHEYDADTGLSYMNARYYNGKTGRFVSQDPAFLAVGDNDKIKAITKQELQSYLSDPQGFNSYAYARNNPLRIIDPSGEWFKEVIMGRQSWSSFSQEVGQATQYMGSGWQKAMDHPYLAGGVIGVGGGLAAAGGAAIATKLSMAYLQGAGTACVMGCNQIIQKVPTYAQQAFRTFEAFKRSVGAADSTGQNLRQWHHVVEQNASNTGRFGQEAIQNGKNIVNIPTNMHQQVTSFYNSSVSQGFRFRDYVNTLNFSAQQQIGQKVLDNVANGRLPGTGLGF